MGGKFTQRGRYFLSLITAGHLVERVLERGDNQESLLKVRFRKDSASVLEGKTIARTYKVDTDTGAFLVEVKKDSYESARVLRMAISCSAISKRGTKIFTVGFPKMELRRNGQPNAEEKSKDSQIHKRWSEGRYTGARFDGRYIQGETTSADSLVGSVGGPVISENGDVVALLLGGVGAYDEAYEPYKGSTEADEAIGQIESHSVVMECSVLRRKWLDHTNTLRARVGE